MYNVKLFNQCNNENGEPTISSGMAAFVATHWCPGIYKKAQEEECNIIKRHIAIRKDGTTIDAVELIKRD